MMADPFSALFTMGDEWVFAVLNFLDMPTLGALLAASHRSLQQASAPSMWEPGGWRIQHLEAPLPHHVRWRPFQMCGLGLDQSAVRPATLRCAAQTRLLLRGVRLYEDRRFDQASCVLRTLLQELPECPSIMCRLADALYGKSVVLPSAVQPKQAPRPQRPSGAAQVSADAEPAAAATAAGRPQTAEVAVGPGSSSEEEEESSSDDVPYHLAEARTMQEGEDTRESLMEQARSLYTEAYRIDPTCSYAVNGLALFAEESEKQKLLEEAVRLDNENPYALANLGGELVGQDDRRALKLLTKALEVNPRLFYARLCKSRVLLQLGDLDGAIQAVREQLAWQPGDSTACRFLAQLEFRRELVRAAQLVSR